jgi:hypothetical protein
LAQSPGLSTKHPHLVVGGIIPHGSKMYRFQQKLKNFKQKLKAWNKQTFGNIFEAQKKLTDQMGIIQSQIHDQGISEDLKTQEATISQKLEERKSQEEILWRKKSLHPMAKGGRSKHQVLPQVYHSKKTCQSHYTVDHRKWANPPLS